MSIFVLVIASFLVLIALITILNALTFPRLTRYVSLTKSVPVRLSASKSVEESVVSILVPARDEAPVIAETIRSWLNQDYPNYEVILLDDASADGTAEIALQTAAEDKRFRLLRGEPLPPGWLGKNWACHQLAQAARGDILLFTDADVRWSPAGLSAIVAEMPRTRADLLTVWPRQITHTWAERLIVPLMALSVIGYLSVLAVHSIPWTVFSAAIGQCLAFRRTAYEQIGGHVSVQSSVIEDMDFARAIKRKHLRLRMAEGAGLASTRMYHNWSEVRDGFAKNILQGHGGSVTFLLFSTLFHWSLFLFPWLWLAAGLAGWGEWQAPLILATLGVLVRALTAAVTRQRVQDALLMPVSVLLMTIIAMHSLHWHFRGAAQWKGRTYQGG